MKYIETIQEEYNKINGKLHLPDVLLNRILEDYRSTNSLEKYIKNVQLVNNDTVLGFYNFEDGTIFISWPVMIGMSLKTISLKNYSPYYHLCVETLYHELTHAKQYKLMANEGSISEALNFSCKLGINDPDKYNSKEYYPFFPHEYNAFLEGKIQVSKFCELYGLEDDNESISDYILSRYQYCSPIEKLNLSYEVKGYLTQSERVQYGLPVKQETLSLISKCDNKKIKRFIKC